MRGITIIFPRKKQCPQSSTSLPPLPCNSTDCFKDQSCQRDRHFLLMHETIYPGQYRQTIQWTTEDSAEPEKDIYYHRHSANSWSLKMKNPPSTNRQRQNIVGHSSHAAALLRKGIGVHSVMQNIFAWHDEYSALFQLPMHRSAAQSQAQDMKNVCDSWRIIDC